MASKGKARKKSRRAKPLDLEAIGLVLLSAGIFLLGLLIPSLPTGELGRSLRQALLAPIGWGAYALPWPLLALGAVFLLRRNPKAWPRMLIGYLVLVVGLWLALVLAAPSHGGTWGGVLRGYLTGVVGWLAYLPTFVIVSLGVELILAWRPGRIVQTTAVRTVQLLRVTLVGAWQARKRAKARAAFHADIALARRALGELDRDLVALASLYPGSAELEKWRQQVAASRKRLATADPEILKEVQADVEAWQGAVADFAKDRTAELSLHIEAEGLPDFEGWWQGIKAQLDDPVGESSRLGHLLDGLRKAMALDLTALSARHRRLARERDVAGTTLAAMTPRQLAEAYEQHQRRLAQHRHIRVDAEALESDVNWLEPWRDLVGKLARLEGEFPEAEALREYSESLVGELRSRGRSLLADIKIWQRELDGVELHVRQQVAVITASPQERAGTSTEGGVAPSAPRSAPEATALEMPESFEQRAADGWRDTFEELPVAEFSVEGEQEVGELLIGPSPTAGEEDGVAEVRGIPIQLPDLELLDTLEQHQDDPAVLAREVQERVRKIDETLANFKLEGRVVASVRGPTVTRFEVEPAPGEKISRFANLSDDLALAMAVGSVRIEAPIPGKSVIGLEVPNANRDLIKFREAVEAASFRRSRARLPLILGKSIDGEMVVGDLVRMPHLLIAGSTGSGKSVAVNTLIGSLLYKFLPTELRFLMIDPKMVELTPFDGVPHLLRPVVTNPNDAAGVLLGAVAHMERRYKMMSKIGAKNLDQYNEKARNLDLPQMPIITIIIDELADLMITSPKEVESAIMRLAQMARATGMHLILATQRPSVDILTSLIKVNVPARIAFAVSSGHDSRTILDTMGAERLIGLGDMLFYQPGLVKPVRLQGPFISEREIAQLGAFLRRQYFDDEFVEAYGADFDPPSLHESDASGLIDWNDDKLRDAAELVITEGQASVSRLQRRLSVGHARAGKLMDSLEALGVVGPHVGSKPREVLVDIDELPNIFGK